MSTKSVSLMIFLFTTLALTHASFVDYRSGAAEIQPQFKDLKYSKLTATITTTNNMLFLQIRKLAGVEIIDLDSDSSSNNNRRSSSSSIWRGSIKSKWIENGLCCGVFDLLVKMKGNKTRKMILKSLYVEPKNKHQLSHELSIDWKAVDGHINKLLEYNLLAVVAIVGTCKVYAITQKGKRALEMIDEDECNKQQPSM